MHFCWSKVKPLFQIKQSLCNLCKTFIDLVKAALLLSQPIWHRKAERRRRFNVFIYSKYSKYMGNWRRKGKYFVFFLLILDWCNAVCCYLWHIFYIYLLNLYSTVLFCCFLCAMSPYQIRLAAFSFQNNLSIIGQPLLPPRLLIPKPSLAYWLSLQLPSAKAASLSILHVWFVFSLRSLQTGCLC